MRFNNILEVTLGSKSKIKILRAMLKVRTPLTGRKLAALAGINHRTCLLSLRELADEGFVSVRAAGKSKIYTPNIENTFLKESIAKLFSEEQNLLSSLLRAITTKLKGKIV